MGRPKTIFVDEDSLLRAIGRQITRDVRRIDRELCAGQMGHGLRREIERDREFAFWPIQELDAWTGRELTPSERIRHQQAICKLAADGLVERDGRRVALTAAGWTRTKLRRPK